MNMQYFDLETIRKTPMLYTPYPNTSISYAIYKDKVDSLRETFPKDHYKFYSRKMGHDKTYKLCGRHLIVPGRNEPEYPAELSIEWQQLCKELFSQEYRDAISDLIKVDLSNTYLGVDLWRSW